MANQRMSFTDIYDVKQFYIEQVAPKYFDLEEINQFNAGLLGYTTEMVSVATEETFNAINTMFKEHFVSKATFPDTLYTKAGLYGLDASEASPATMRFALFINEADVMRYGELINGTRKFVIDRRMTIYIEEVPHTVDYDIVISAIDSVDEIIYTAQYDMGFENSISKIESPQLRVNRAKVENTDYIVVIVDVRQYQRTVLEEPLISNATLNFPVINVTYPDQFAGMDVFYRENESQPWSVLTKKYVGLPPSKDPFIYYAHKDTNAFELSFTSRDNFFKPVYNSDIMVIVYTTTGSKGNFKKYVGNNIGIAGSNEVYGYNSNILLFGYPVGGAVGGYDKKTLEDLRARIIEAKGTSGAYNTDTDLETYFNNRNKENENIFVKFVKRRDDLAERKFSCFGLYRDEDGNYLHTNTLNMTLTESDFDKFFDGGNRMILEAGRLFLYRNSRGVTIERGYSVGGNNSHPEYFKFTNPFIISMQKNPNSISFYKNSVDKQPALEYIYSSSYSAYQFVASTMSITRNAINGDRGYKFSVTIKPLFEMTIEDGELNLNGGNIKLILSTNENGDNTKAVFMELETFSIPDQTLTYSCTIESTDEIGSSERVVVKDMYDVNNGLLGEQTIPMIDAIYNITIMAEDTTITGEHPFRHLPGLENFIRVASFSNTSEPVTIIQPMKHVKSTVKFLPIASADGKDSYTVDISMVPLMSFDQALNPEKVNRLLQEVESHYNSINEIVRLKTQNYSLDMKFYNTFGQSNNISSGGSGNAADLIDRTNLSLRIQISFLRGFIVEDEVLKIRYYIKDHIENLSKAINQDVDKRGYNAFYSSKLIQELTNNFPSIRYIGKVIVNEQGGCTQIIENETYDIDDLDKEALRNYVPEFMSIDFDQITVDIL